MLDQIEAAVTNAKWLRRAGLLPGSFAVALVALVLGMLATGADAGSDFKWEPMTDADWAVKEDQARGIRDAVVIFEKTVEDDEEMLSKRCYYSVYSRIRILSAEGRQRGDVVLPYVRKQHEIKEIRGRTVNRDGKVFPLEESKVYDKETVSSEGAKLKRKAFSLPAVSEDCIVEYYYRYQLK